MNQLTSNMLNHFACVSKLNITLAFAAVVLLLRLFVATRLKKRPRGKSVLMLNFSYMIFFFHAHYLTFSIKNHTIYFSKSLGSLMCEVWSTTRAFSARYHICTHMMIIFFIKIFAAHKIVCSQFSNGVLIYSFPSLLQHSALSWCRDTDGFVFGVMEKCFLKENNIQCIQLYYNII